MIGHPKLASLLGNSWWWTLLLHSDDLESANWHFYVSYPVCLGRGDGIWLRDCEIGFSCAKNGS